MLNEYLSNSSSHFMKLLYLRIDRSRGVCPAHAPPHGTQFFCFRIHFHRKVPTLEVHAPPPPPQRVHAPPTGNPGSATVCGMRFSIAKRLNYSSATACYHIISLHEFVNADTYKQYFASVPLYYTDISFIFISHISD